MGDCSCVECFRVSEWLYRWCIMASCSAGRALRRWTIQMSLLDRAIDAGELQARVDMVIFNIQTTISSQFLQFGPYECGFVLFLSVHKYVYLSTFVVLPLRFLIDHTEDARVHRRV